MPQSRIRWKVHFLGSALLVFLTNLPFLPGPSFLYWPAEILYTAGQLGGLLGLVLVPLGGFLTVREILRARRQTDYHPKQYSFWLWICPVVLILSTAIVGKWTRGIARDTAIERAQSLIASIEQYKAQVGTYPRDFEQLQERSGTKIPSPLIIGIEEYLYVRSDTSYSLNFAQNVLMFWNYEIVEYWPDSSHRMREDHSGLMETGHAGWK